MSLTINRTDRDALHDSLMTNLTAIGDIFINLHNDEPIPAKRLRRRFEVELRLLDDLRWEKEPDQERFELTMPARELRPIIERIYWSAVGSLANHPEELVEEAVYQLRNATSACPEVLARLAEDDLLDPEACQGVHLAGFEAASE
jgi:hypothetical protein